MPSVSPGAELASLKAHSRFFEHSRGVGLALEDCEKSRILQICEPSYGPARYSLPSDWLSYTHYERVLRSLEFTSSPGFPYCMDSSSIGSWLGWDGFEFDPAQVERLWYDVCAVISGEFESLYRVFVKAEPHKVAKARAERWRLIICPPLCEQVVWKMVFGPGNDREIETVGQTPSLQGMSLPAGNWKFFYQLFRSKNLKVPMDKTAWDWTAHIEFIELDLKLRLRLLQAEHLLRERWHTLASALYRRAFYHPTLVLSDGTLWQQEVPGIMKSGCVNTISSNSHMQLFVHVLACLRKGVSPYPLPVAVGDDTLSSWQNAFDPEFYRFTGALVKDVSEEMEFVGHQWSATGVVPSYVSKHMFRFAMVDEQHVDQFLESMVRLYPHHPAMTRLWRALALRRGVNLPSHEYVLWWYDYPDDVIWY